MKQIVINIAWMFAGALIPLYLAKFQLIEIDGQTNVVLPTLIWLLLLSGILTFKVFGI